VRLNADSLVAQLAEGDETAALGAAHLEDFQLTDRKQTLEAFEDAPNPLPRLRKTLQALLERVALGRLLHGYDAPAAAET